MSVRLRGLLNTHNNIHANMQGERGNGGVGERGSGGVGDKESLRNVHFIPLFPALPLPRSPTFPLSHSPAPPLS
jgi:hypothetical protein